jgi:quercetin dioxygenase-like cupin family protein
MTTHHHGEVVRFPLDAYLIDGLDERGLFRLINVDMLADHAPLPVPVSVPDQDITASPLARSSELTGQPHPETGTTDSATLGVDLLYVPPGGYFPPHVHPGHHLLMSVKGRGSITYGDEEISVRRGDLYFIQAEIAHAVGSEAEGPGHWLLSFGAPHKRVEATDRMRLIETAEHLADTPTAETEKLIRNLPLSP